MISWWGSFVFCLLVVSGFVAEWLLGCCSMVTSHREVRQSQSNLQSSSGCQRGRGIRLAEGSSLSKRKPGRGMSMFAFWMTFLFLWRVGEANNPGPDDSWTLGTFNPSGVTSKADVIGQLGGDFWGMCETHLSDIGRRRFVHALRCQKSRWTHVVPGAPCPLRSRSEEVGTFKGVASISSWPTRALAHSLNDGWYQSARVQVVGTFIHQLWVNVAIVYGFPYSRTHHAPRFQTEQL